MYHRDWIFHFGFSIVEGSSYGLPAFGISLQDENRGFGCITWNVPGDPGRESTLWPEVLIIIIGPT